MTKNNLIRLHFIKYLYYICIYSVFKRCDEIYAYIRYRFNEIFWNLDIVIIQFMYTHYTVYNVQCALYIRTLYNVQCTMYNVH